MKFKKTITTIITIIIISSLMMTIQINNVSAASIGKVYNLESRSTGEAIYFEWDSVANADGYNLYINTSNKGYEYIGSITSNNVTAIGFESSKTYHAKVGAYIIQSNGSKKEGELSDAIKVNTAVESKPEQVKNFSATSNKEIVTLTWSKVSNVSGYQVFAEIGEYGFFNVGTVTSTSAMLKINNGKDGESFRFKVRAIKNTNGITTLGDFSSIKKITLDLDERLEIIVPPSRVQNVKVTTDENTATIKWDKVTDATGYEVTILKNGNQVKKSNLSGTSMKISGLDFDTTYQVKVRAYNIQVGKTVYSDNYSSVVKFTTEEEIIAPAQVKNVSIKADIEEATVTWTKVSDATRYQVWLGKGTSNLKLYDEVTTNKIVLEDLDDDTTYRVKVRAIKKTSEGNIYGEYSLTKSFTTKEIEKIENPAQVKNVKITVDEDEAIVSWSKVADVDYYEIAVSRNNGSFKIEKVTTASNINFEALKEDVIYRVKVRAVRIENDTDYYGEYSEIKSFEIEAEEKEDNDKNNASSNKKVGDVENFKVTVKNRNEAYLSWWPVDNAQKYEVYIATTSGSYRKVDTTTGYSSIIYDLDYETTYRVKVVAIGKTSSNTSTSVVKRFETEEYNKKVNNTNIRTVENVTTYVSGDKVYLNWNQVSNVDGYEISLTVPGLSGASIMNSTTNSKTISGITEKNYDYTVRIRAYVENNGIRTYGSYSTVEAFRAK